MLTADPKTKACKRCGTAFIPRTSMHTLCSPTCALRDAREVVASKAKAKRDEKKADRAKREEQKTIPQLIKEAQIEFNAYIRARDAGKPCICCGQPLGSDAVGGGYDCGHYRSTGSASHLRFDERNAHAQRKHCNRYGAGRAVDYRIGLIARIGLAAVEALEADNDPVKLDRDALRQIKVIYRAKARELKKGQA